MELLVILFCAALVMGIAATFAVVVAAITGTLIMIGAGFYFFFIILALNNGAMPWN